MGVVRHLLRLNSRRFAATALLVLLAGQLSVLAHAVAIEHEPGEVCEVCVSTDRLSDALVAADNSLDFAPLRTIDAPVLTAAVHTRFARIHRSRGPPSV